MGFDRGVAATGTTSAPLGKLVHLALKGVPAAVGDLDKALGAPSVLPSAFIGSLPMSWERRPLISLANIPMRRERPSAASKSRIVNHHMVSTNFWFTTTFI